MFAPFSVSSLGNSVSHVLACLLFASVVLAESAFADDSKIIEAAALINDSLSKGEKCTDANSLTVGFHPFKNSETPLSQNVADLLHKDILSKLINSAKPCTAYISITGAGQALDAMNKTGELQKNGSQRIGQIEEGMHKADFTLLGTVYELNQTFYLELSLLDKSNGKTIVNTGAIGVPSKYTKRICGDGSLNLEAAAADIGSHFKDRFAKVRILVPDGFSYGNTGIHTDFSDYLADLLENELSNVYWDKLINQGLSIRKFDDKSFEEVRKFRGLSLTSKQVEQTRLKIDDNQSPDVYHISGRYWPCGKEHRSVNLSVSMANPSGERVTWKKFVRLDTLPDTVNLEPQKKPSKEVLVSGNWNAPAQFDFNMSSNRGDNPSFHSGEELFLSVRTERDAWLFCFYTNSDGGMVQFIPNPTMDKHTPNRNFFARQILHIVPDHNKRPLPDRYDLKINDTTVGVEAIKCIATSRNVTNELPEALRGDTFQILPQSISMRIRQIFDSLPNIELAEQNMTITVRN